MTNKSKQKGNNFERELVKQAQEFELKAKRAWGSNGESLGLEPDVDLIIDDYIKVQAKLRRKLPDCLQIPKSCDVTVFRQDRGETLMLMRWKEFLEFVNKIK
ncbi:hypothetical protein KY314_02905 [Candidatus Woesearchaeota archaeon]|nr:hypothetical protein [Candidatus Woesearchaeota archaeon]